LVQRFLGVETDEEVLQAAGIQGVE
jgi:hypothetical protein